MDNTDQASPQPVFGRQLGFGKRAAVLVVDLTRAFTDPDRPLGSHTESVIDATNQLIDSARKRGQPVIFTTVFYDAPDFSDAGVWRLKIGGQDDLRGDSDGWEIDPRLHRQGGDALLTKKYASCFFGTDLSSRLTSLGVDTLVVCGVSTSGCVRATAVDAIQHGFRPIIGEEAVGDRWPEAHRQSLADLQAKYADVLPVATVCEALLRTG